jgi:hypothetical protein
MCPLPESLQYLEITSLATDFLRVLVTARVHKLVMVLYQYLQVLLGEYRVFADSLRGNAIPI